MGVLIDRDFSEQRALEYGYRVVEFMKKGSLKDAAIEINFYPKSLIESLVEKSRSSMFSISEVSSLIKPYRIGSILIHAIRG